MMQRLANDPSFWLSVWTLVGLLLTAAGALVALLIAWAKAKTAEYEAKSAKGTAETVAQGQGVQQVTLVQHTAQIAALEAVQGAGGSGAGATTSGAAPVAPTVPVAPPSVPMATIPTPTSVTTPTGVPMPLSSSSPAAEHTTGGTLAVPANGYPPPPET